MLRAHGPCKVSTLQSLLRSSNEHSINLKEDVSASKVRPVWGQRKFSSFEPFGNEPKSCLNATTFDEYIQFINLNPIDDDDDELMLVGVGTVVDEVGRVVSI